MVSSLLESYSLKIGVLPMEETKVIRKSPALPIFIASPEEGSGPYPVVLLFMHKPGLDEPMKIVCRDLAKAGYFAIGFDEYHGVSLKPEDLTDESVFKDFEMTLDYVKSLDGIDISRLGVIGFCMGGRHVYLSTARYSEIKAREKLSATFPGLEQALTGINN